MHQGLQQQTAQSRSDHLLGQQTAQSSCDHLRNHLNHHCPSCRRRRRKMRSSRSCGSAWPRCRRPQRGPGRGRRARPCARACLPRWPLGGRASSVPSWRSVHVGWRPTGRPASRRGRRRPHRRCALPSGTAYPSWLPACQDMHGSSSGHPQLDCYCSAEEVQRGAFWGWAYVQQKCMSSLCVQVVASGTCHCSQVWAAGTGL